MQQAKPNPHTLNERFASGGFDALEEAVVLYEEKLLRYAASILAGTADAEDIVQDVFITAYENREAFDGQNLSAWLYKITYNRSVNHLKRRKRFVYREQVTPDMNPDITDGMSGRTRAALFKLKPADRALIHGRVMDERSYDDLASELGVSPAALRKRYERVKKKLAKLLSQKQDKGGHEK
ncbi:MAG: RNA polymerase sigma factor [Defluviitaleaceae bacterium]|nr:RNA polymerase sigma factor [Defluviitaleaceae bacterium]